MYNHLHWKALDAQNEVWLELVITPDHNFQIMVGSEDQALFILKILNKAQLLNPNFDFWGKRVETQLEFSRHWGLGSSSTFLVCIAQWAQVDPFELFFSTMKGSGYDIAVGVESESVAYKLVEGKAQYKTQNIPVNTKETLYFIYLGKKQISSTEVQAQEKKIVPSELIIEINRISQSLLQNKTAQEWDEILEKHEEITAQITGKIPIKKQLFDDYPHLIKSLGAWGGDFILARAYLSTDLDYFKHKGFNTILPFEDLVLS
jgi:hypothetical protein